MSAGADRAPLWQEEAVAALVHELRTPVSTIRALSEMMMQAPDMDGAERQSSAAVAMAGLAGHAVDEMALYGTNNAGPRAAAAAHSEANPNANAQHHPPLDTPHGMALDLTTLFEAAGGTFSLNGFDNLSALPNGEHAGYGGGSASANGLPAYGTENDELARIMKDLF